MIHSGFGYAVFAFVLGALVVVGLALLRQNRLVEAFGLAAAETTPGPGTESPAAAGRPLPEPSA